MKKLKRVLIIAIVCIPMFTGKQEKTTLPVSAYAVWEDDHIKASSIWFNLPKDKRQEIINKMYKQNKSY